MRTYVVDLETTDLRSDIGTLIVASFGRLNDDDEVVEKYTHTIQSIGTGSVAKREKMLAQFARKKWAEADIIIGQNHKAFDRHFLDGVLFRCGLEMLPGRLLIDTYQTAKGKLAMGTSMGNMVDIFGIGTKDAPSKDDWRRAAAGDSEALKRIMVRCESDVDMTAKLWKRLKPLYMARQS
jgi:DNA polymerase elongation subunit (family B)